MENNIFESKLFKGVVIGIIGLIILTVVFGLGQEFINASGAFGRITKIATFEQSASPTILTIKGKNNIERNIIVDGQTRIVRKKKNIKLSELENDDEVVIIGDSTTRGQIRAGLIRVMPAVHGKK